MSKAEVLRGFVRERLAAAAQEITEVVDTIVAGYEEEASDLRQEIERQRRELEVLQRTGVKCSRSLGPVEEEEGDHEEEHGRPEDPDHSTNQSPSRFKKRKPGRPQISETQSHVDFRVRILEDSHTDTLSNTILKKCPALKLKCPRGLKQADFVGLLKSTFPQLSGCNQSFDILTSEEGQRLQPVRLKTLTPEGILCTGRAETTLYIRLKTPEEPEACEEEIHQRKVGNTEESLSNSDTQTSDETRNDDGNRESSPAQKVEDSCCLLRNSTSQQEKGTEQAEDENHGMSEPAGSEGECSHDVEEQEERGDANDSDDDFEAQTKTQRAGRSGVNATEKKNGNSNNVLSCKVCGVSHKSETAFVQHAWSHQDDPGRVCGVCGELSESVESLKEHLESSHRTDNCHICGESFLSVLSLGERPYECKTCGDLHENNKEFDIRSSSQLKGRRRNHTNRKTHRCGECGKSLCDYRSLSRHKMTHSEERPHGCQVCGRRFKLPGTLRQHEKIHTDRERLYLCDVCCKMFLTSKQLQIHLRTHTNEKPYHCGECGKGFTTKGLLTIHMRVHTGETPYRCPDCGWSFKRKLNLDDHMKVHSGHKPFVCGICGKACARKTYLTVHMRTHNGERPYKCTVCEKAFTQSHCLKTHMKSHQVAAT